MNASAAASRHWSSAYAPPSRRRLRVFTLDPTTSRRNGSTTVLSVPWEPLDPGPRGSRIAVEDWRPDGTFLPGVDLDDPALLAQDGLAPDESDFRFHQQMTYAVIASLLEALDHARGRRLIWTNVWRSSDSPGIRRPMPVYPHRLEAANAFYEPGQGLSFGFYRAGESATELFPGQWVHGCLSHDILVHEASHAFLHEVRPLSLNPTGPEAMAFHEAFADIVATLQHFTLPGLLESELADFGADLWHANPFVELAGEFGRGAGKGGAVRRALDDPDEPAQRSATTDPHTRGAVLVAALFEAFFTAYRQRISPLLRLAGVGQQPSDGALPRELIDLACREARAAATMVLTMTVRALDYLPPTDISFAQFLDAVLAADTDLYPEDRRGFRRLLTESARRRGIMPSLLPGQARSERPQPISPMPTRQALLVATHDLTGGATSSRADVQLERSWRTALLAWGRSNAGTLNLNAESLTIDGGNASFRMDQDQFPTAVVTARFAQRNLEAEARLPARLLGRLPLIGGTTVIATASGRITHLFHSPVPGIGTAGRAALDRMVDESDLTARAWMDCVGEQNAAATEVASLPSPRGASPLRVSPVTPNPEPAA